MANKRMFSMKIVDSDSFLDMPLTSQCLYFHLNMRADDDGFIGNPRRIAKLIGCSDDDLKLLIMKRFVISFDDGVIVIKHWRMHNSIQKDRYTPTTYQDEFKKLGIKDNKSYTTSLETKCIQNVSTDLDIGLDIDIDIVDDNKRIIRENTCQIHLRNIEAKLYDSARANELDNEIVKAYEITGILPSTKRLEDIILKITDGGISNEQGYIIECFKGEKEWD